MQLTFADDGALDPRITFSRTSTATYFDSTGTMQTAAIDAPRFDHDPAALTVFTDTELVTNGDGSSTTGWVQQDGVTTSVNGRFRVASTGSVYPLLYQGIPTTIGRKYRFTAEAFAGTGNDVFVRVGDSPGNTQHLNSTSLGTNTVDFVATAATTYVSFYGNDLVSGEYVEFDNISLRALDAEPLGLLVEEARTNLLTYSQELDHASWPKVGVTITANAALAPDGTSTAEQAAFGSGAAEIQKEVTITAGATYTASVWAKRAPSGSATAIRLSSNNAAAWNTGGSTKLVLTDTWQRVTLTGTISGGATTWRTVIGRKNAAGTDDPDCLGNVLLWGAQLEAGSFATSYIPTTSASVARSADSASMTGTNFSDWYNQSEGTFVMELDTGGHLPRYGDFFLNGDSSASQFLYSEGGNSTISSYNGANLQKTNGGSSLSSGAKVAVAYSAAGRSLTIDGAVPSTDAVPFPTNLTVLYLGMNNAGAGIINGHIKSLTYYATRKSDADLQALTA